MTLIDALVEASEARELTVVSNNLGEPGKGLGKLLRQGRVRRAVGSFFTSNPEVAAAVQAEELEVVLLPQGTLAEALRAAGAGIGGFFTGRSRDRARARQGRTPDRRGRARARGAAPW